MEAFPLPVSFSDPPESPTSLPWCTQPPWGHAWCFPATPITSPPPASGALNPPVTNLSYNPGPGYMHHGALLPICLYRSAQDNTL